MAGAKPGILAVFLSRIITQTRKEHIMKKLLPLLALLLALATVASGETLTLSFVGDCSIGEMTTARSLDTCYTKTLQRYGYDWPFSLVRDYLEADDFTFANNEVVFTDRTKCQDKKFNLKGPASNAQTYLYSGIDAVNTVNNHALDFFEGGYNDTILALDQYLIRHFGSLYPGSKYEQDQLGVYEVKGVKIGAIGFSYPQDSDVDKIAYRISLLQAMGCDLVMVSLHWGREEKTSPESWQLSYARKIIQAGADVIWGHHPHILQQVQFYQGKPIFYSTGNFTFGSIKALDPDTGIFQLRYDLTADGPVLVNFSVIPCRTQGKGDFRPYPLTDPDEKAAMLKKLIYPREIGGMVNLPAAFAQTGSVDIVNGELVEEQ